MHKVWGLLDLCPSQLSCSYAAIHNNCYGEAKKHSECKFLIDHPYTKTYAYSCSSSDVTCSDDNDECAAFICECDRSAAICFAGAPYQEKYKQLDTDKFCK